MGQCHWGALEDSTEHTSVSSHGKRARMHGDSSSHSLGPWLRAARALLAEPLKGSCGCLQNVALVYTVMVGTSILQEEHRYHLL